MQLAAIVILNYNGEEILQKFLPSVVSFSKFKIFVADNGSTDRSVEILKKGFPEVDLIILDSNHGFTGGYNRALDTLRAEFEYYILLNSDVEVNSGWDRGLIRFLQTHPNTAAVQPKMLSFPNPEYFDYAGAGGGFLDHLGYPYCRGRIFDSIEKDLGQYNDEINVDWASGACMAVRSEIFHKTGGFDERFFAHMEEIDLCLRFRNLGFDIHYIGEVEVYHLGGGTLHKSNPHKTFLNFRNNLLMLYKYKSNFPKVYSARIILDTIAALVFLIRGSFKDGKAVFSAHVSFNKMKNLSNQAYLPQNDLKRNSQKMIKSILWEYYFKGKKTFGKL